MPMVMVCLSFVKDKQDVVFQCLDVVSWGGTIGGSCLESIGADPIDDGIPSELRPLTSYSGQETIWANGLGTAWQDARYSDPVIVLWQRNGPATKHR